MPRDNAGVTCVIIGIRCIEKKNKTIFTESGIAAHAKNINPYLVDASNIFIEKRSKSLSGFPIMKIGNKPIDNGNYLFTPSEKDSFLREEPNAKKFFYRWYGCTRIYPRNREMVFTR